MAAITAPNINHDGVTFCARTSCIRAAGAQAVGCEVTNLSKREQGEVKKSVVGEDNSS